MESETALKFLALVFVTSSFESMRVQIFGNETGQLKITCMKKLKAKCEERESQQDATIRCLLSTSVSTCFEHHYAHLQENKDRFTAHGVLRWFCWVWLVAVVWGAAL